MGDASGPNEPQRGGPLRGRELGRWEVSVCPEGATFRLSDPADPWFRAAFTVPPAVLADLLTAVNMERLASHSPWDEAVSVMPEFEIGGESGVEGG